MTRHTWVGLLIVGSFEAGCSCTPDPVGLGGGGASSTSEGSGASSTAGGQPSGGSTAEFMGVGGGGACVGLECQQVPCSGGAKTTVSGKVFEPAGKTPLYNVVVYVPNAPLDPLPEGASCDACSAQVSGSPIVSAITDATGSFVLEDVPVGADIPLVVQVGKWRREITIPSVAECVDTPMPDGTVRLPRNQSEGHLPRIALSTGGADPLECLLPKIGLDLAEFTNPDGTGRVHLYHGNGGTNRYAGGPDFPSSTDLWSTVDTLRTYDIVLLACEGGQNGGSKPATALQAMSDYADLGGRVFASHWHNYWFEAGPGQLPNVAVFNHQPDLQSPFTAKVDQSFPKGAALASWLVNVGASTVLGDLVVTEAQHTIDAVNPGISTRWIYGDSPTSVQYLTLNTPIGTPEEQQCGRMVLSDIHVSSGDPTGGAFPQNCQTTELSPQEKALLFMLFDLSACIIPDDDPPAPPVQ